MLTLSVRRKAFALLLLVPILAASAAPAASSRPLSPSTFQVSGPDGLALFGRAWSFLRHLGGKAGCDINPDGRCKAPQAKAGCEIDPDGRCKTPQAKAGCEIDPNGRCHS
jgi:hypothetical protein